MPHIDLLPGAYQGSLACTEGPSTEIFLPETSPSPSEVAGMMGVSVQDLMRANPEILALRDLLLEPCFESAFSSSGFSSQRAGDACLMEGGIVHRGPGIQGGSRTSAGRLQLFWVVTPTYHYEHYSSDSQTWVGEVELQMAVEGAEAMRDALVERAAERIAAHRPEYPSFDKMPWNKLEALYKRRVGKGPIAKRVATQAKKECNRKLKIII